MAVSGGMVEGVLCRADDVQQVFSLMNRPDLDEVILLTSQASATAVVPLLAKVRGVVSESGGMTSHLAIVAREFNLPCILSAELDEADLEGRRVVLQEDGIIESAPEAAAHH
ncbi:MAG: PEP-utilizing enzyme [Solirubrobacterales bacterium]